MKTLAKFLEMNCMMKLIITSIMLITLIKTKAQETDGNIIRPVQITLVTPVGSNGMQSPEVCNNFSLNLIGGYNGGVHGVEIGGFANVLKSDMNGAQIAGFANLVNGNTSGAQVAGFLNLNKSDVTGAQVAGFTNIVRSNTDAVQVSGFLNYTHGKAEKAQVAGFANIVKDDVKSAQVAGFTNISSGTVKGCQVAGFANYSHEKIVGAQIAGFLNYAKTIHGTQIGVINVSDSVEKGVPIGVFSWVKNGYRAIEVGSSETVHGIISFKTGTRYFYNIFSVGAVANNQNSWAIGYGIGTMLPLAQKMDVSLEATAFHLNEEENWTEELNLLNRLNLSLSYNLNNYLSVYGGVSLNVAISNLKDAEGNLSGSSLIPYHYYNKNHNGTNVKMYPGFNLGLRVKL